MKQCFCASTSADINIFKGIFLVIQTEYRSVPNPIPPVYASYANKTRNNNTSAMQRCQKDDNK